MMTTGTLKYWLHRGGVLLPLLWLFFGMQPHLHAQDNEYLLKAGFLERFTRFIDWPEDSLQLNPALPFTILVMGKSPFNGELEDFFRQIRVKNRKVRIRYSATADTTRSAHLIYICSDMAKKLPGILRYTQGKPIITVGETRGFAEKGVLINFFLENNKIRFEINQSAFKRSGLKVSYLLMNSARVIP